MTLNQIRYFYAAAVLGNIGRAAKQEMISQPSMSAAIHSLEDELGVPLFTHSGRGVVLSKEGEEFLGYARSILDQCSAAQAHMKEHSDRLNRQIRFAYTATMANAYIPELIRDFCAGYPHEVQIFMDEMSSREIAAGIRQGSLDIGICSEIDDSTDLYQKPLMYHPLLLIVPPGHPYAQLKPEELPGSPEELCGEPFIAYKQEFPMYRVISLLFRSHGCQANNIFFAYSEDAIARLVEQGLGISIIAETESLPQYNISILRPDWLKGGRFIYLTYAPHFYRGKAAEAMLQFISSKIQF